MRWIAPALGLLVLCGCAERRVDRPDIVLIIGDDVGWPDYGFMGSHAVLTPNLDRLASEGTVFTHAFDTASVCKPSLSSLLTGLHPIQTTARLEALRAAGVEIPAHEEITHFETLPSQLGRAGYASFQGGKYWEGTYDLAGFTDGMTTSYGDEASGASELANDIHEYSGGAGLLLGRETMEPLWDFLEAHADDPFFVWFAPMLPHTPHDAPERFVDLYRDARIPDEIRGYYANLTRLDERVGEVLDRLDRDGLRAQTIVVYLADNGFDARSPVRHAAFGGHRGKLSSYELGFRTPLVVSWPGVLPSGAFDPQLVSTVDLVATLLDFAGAEPLPNRPGSSLRARLEGTGAFARERVFAEMELERNPDWFRGDRDAPKVRAGHASFVRTPMWRLVRGPEQRDRRLYRIDEDPFEERNVRLHHPRVVEDLEREIETWRAEMVAPWSRLP